MNAPQNISILYRDNKSNILAVLNPTGGWVAYAIDTHEFGFYNGTSWLWSANPGDPTLPVEASMFLHNDNGIEYRQQNSNGSFIWLRGDIGCSVSSILMSSLQALLSTTELISNGTFETGTLTGWTTTGSPVVTGNAFTGSYCAKCTASNTIKQTVTVVNGDYYVLEFAVKMDDDADFHGIVSITNGDVSSYDAGNQHGGRWIRGAAIIRATSTSMILEFSAAGGTNFVYFDVISLKHCTSFSLEGVDSSANLNVVNVGTTPLLVNGVDVISKLVTNGDSHNHVGGDGAALTYQNMIMANPNNNTVALSTTSFLLPLGDAFVASGNFPIPLAGTLKNMYVRTLSTQPASGSLVVTLQIGSVDTAITLTIAAGAGFATFSDTTHTASINAGDLLRWKFVNNATAASAQITAVIVSLESNTG